MLKIIAVCMLCCALPVSAQGLRCGQVLIEAGDVMSKVELHCGAPAERHLYKVPVTYYDNYDKRSLRSYTVEEEYEEWIFNFGPQRFMQKLRFVGGKITNITDLGYGK